jgi:uncharacterized protein
MEADADGGRAGQRIASPLEPLSLDECWTLVEMSNLGRLGVVVAGVPRIFPVNYAAGDGAIVFRTEPGAKLAWGAGEVVCFEIDHYDARSGHGWSVMATGRLEEITHREDAPARRLRSLPVEPLAPGQRGHWLALRVDEMSGRSFQSGWPVPGVFLG